MDGQFLIWSNERGMWWKPGRAGYTTLTHEAGRYPTAEARAIAAAANTGADPGKPNEVLCRVPWGTWGRDQFMEACRQEISGHSLIDAALSDLAGASEREA